MIKNFFVLFLLFFLVGCASKSTVFRLNNTTLTLGQESEKTIAVQLQNPNIRNEFDSCVRSSFIVQDSSYAYGDLFIESIDLYNHCHWNGLASSFFETNFKYALKLDRLEVVENIDLNGFNFKTYKINNDAYVSMIYMYTSGMDRFIVDYYGRVYDTLLKKFKPDYVNSFLSKKRFLGNYNDSLVRKNFFNHYFSEERINVSSSIGIRIRL